MPRLQYMCLCFWSWWQQFVDGIQHWVDISTLFTVIKWNHKINALSFFEVISNGIILRVGRTQRWNETSFFHILSFFPSKVICLFEGLFFKKKFSHREKNSSCVCARILWRNIPFYVNNDKEKENTNSWVD